MLLNFVFVLFGPYVIKLHREMYYRVLVGCPCSERLTAKVDMSSKHPERNLDGGSPLADQCLGCKYDVNVHL